MSLNLKKNFSEIRFLPKNVQILSIKFGDLNKLSKTQLSDALSSDFYLVLVLVILRDG